MSRNAVFLRVSEFADRYALSREQTYRLIRSGRLKAVRFDSRLRIPLESAETLMRASLVEPDAPDQSSRVLKSRRNESAIKKPEVQESQS
jgi:excisionase family DNA binding protein